MEEGAIVGGGDLLEHVVFDFLVNSEQTSLFEVSSQTNERLRSFSERDEHSDSDDEESSGIDAAEDDVDESPRGTGREFPIRRWLFDQTERLTEHVGRFGRLLHEYVTQGRAYPAALLAEQVCPLDISHRRYRHYRSFDINLEAGIQEGAEMQTISIPPDEAAGHFAEGYASYVKSLTASIPHMPRNYPSHLHYTLRSSRRGYRVHSTPLYWLSPTVFGDKRTSPVSGYLPPGLYRFGADRPNNSGPIKWDTGQHLVSPTSKSTIVTAF